MENPLPSPVRVRSLARVYRRVNGVRGRWKRKGERERERYPGDVTGNTERSSADLCPIHYSATHRRGESERARALSGPATRSFCFQPPSSLLLPSTSASTPRGHRYVYRVANRCLLGAYSTVHGELCVCMCVCVCTTHRDVNVRCVGGDTLMTGWQTSNCSAM